MADQELIPVETIALIEDEQNQSPIVILYDRAADRILPIWIGDPEARAIAVVLNNIATPRPLTHQLFIGTLEKLQTKLMKVVVSRLHENTYYAFLHLQQGDACFDVDARPSDAIALALHAKVPVFVHREVMAIAAQQNPFQSQWKGPSGGPRKLDLTKSDVERISDMLKKAREREQASG